MPEQYPRKIIFDMDGVITSEECYWNTAALVVWELLFSRRGLELPLPVELPPFEPRPPASRIKTVRAIIFQEDRVISFFKRRAVNSNWDLAFYTFAFQLVLFLNRHFGDKGDHLKRFLQDEGLSVELLPLLRRLVADSGQDFSVPSFAPITESLDQETGGLEMGAKLYNLLTPSLAAAIPGDTFKPVSLLFSGVHHIFQEWYLGEEGYQARYGRPPVQGGKRGFIEDEEPLLPVKTIKATLVALRQRGWLLGIATGRPEGEIIPPLRKMGLLACFHRPAVVTYDLVEEAQRARETKGEQLLLGKPHPFSLLKAYWGEQCPLEVLLYPPFPAPPAGHCYLVGDAPADLLAARAAGIPFIAVLTGPEGRAGHSLFAGKGAAAILPDLTHIPAFLGGGL